VLAVTAGGVGQLQHVNMVCWPSFTGVNVMSTDLILNNQDCPTCHSEDVHEDLPSVLRCYGCGRVWKGHRKTLME
jgi:hypothetical protein